MSSHNSDFGCLSTSHSQVAQNLIDLELDQLIDTYMTLYSEYLSAMDELQSQMREGFLWLAEARKGLGIDRISSLQYPTNMTANTRVFFDDVSDQRLDTQQSKVASIDATCQPDNSQLQILRQRKYRKTAIQQDSSSSSTSSLKSVQNTSRIKQSQPITWFTALPPPSLRSANKQFDHAIDTIIHLAHLKASMEAIHVKYRQLLKHINSQTS